jgi:alpha-beta hydrolase superfamily lysophospholipase
VGTNGRQMTTILGSPMAKRGVECIAIDMPGYGVTQGMHGEFIMWRSAKLNLNL